MVGLYLGTYSDTMTTTKRNGSAPERPAPPRPLPPQLVAKWQRICAEHPDEARRDYPRLREQFRREHGIDLPAPEQPKGEATA